MATLEIGQLIVDYVDTLGRMPSTFAVLPRHYATLQDVATAPVKANQLCPATMAGWRALYVLRRNGFKLESTECGDVYLERDCVHVLVERLEPDVSKGVKEYRQMVEAAEMLEVGILSWDLAGDFAEVL